MKQTPHFYVCYDGNTKNELSRATLSPHLKKEKIDPESIIHLKKTPYIGTISLLHAAWQLKKTLRKHKQYHLIAFGPLAGIICRYAYNPKACLSLTIQATGLISEEYAYTQAQHHTKFKKLLFKFRSWQLARAEKKAYSSSSKHPIIIETVSTALKEYLVTTFNAERENIKVSHEEAPLTIPPTQCAQWKSSTRTQLHIPSDAKVYCYDDSACHSSKIFNKVLGYFRNELNTNTNSFLLLITSNKQQWTHMLVCAGIPLTHVRLLQATSEEKYRYLAAGDIGILFHDHHITHWVSRPTTALEYLAVQLEIAHDNTVAWLMERASM